MKLTKGQGCFVWVMAALFIVAIQNAQTNPAFLAVMILLILVFVISSVLINKSSHQKTLAQLEQQAVILDELVKRDFKTDDVVFAQQKDEVLVYHLTNVNLTEYKSDGSTYSGGYAGVSFRVAKGVRLNAGQTGGRSTRNPEAETIIDTGAVTATNQRIIFTGGNQVRVFDLAKVVNMEAGPNGLKISISVSNREKTSSLMSNNMNDLTPGMAVSLATAWQEGGKTKAIQTAKDLATQLRQVVAEDRAKDAK